MSIPSLSVAAKTKGLHIIGTGDATHPKWLAEVKEQLSPENDSGLYTVSGQASSPRFILTAEVATISHLNGKSKRIHHLLLLPSIEIAYQLSDILKSKGDLNSDGRPMLHLTGSELVEAVKSVSAWAEVIPAHIWTPWWSLFGSIGGYDSIEQCYEDKVDEIHALETGLSSDPPMNWRISNLDKYVLVSNSDSHSANPHRLGREANVFDLPSLSYRSIIESLRKTGEGSLRHTIETYPQYGKYHWTGHRKCEVVLSPSDSIKIGNKCPKCGRKLTLGVDQRIDEFSDRPAGFQPEDVPGFKYLLPLHEVISSALGCTIYSSKPQPIYDKLVSSFGDEFTVTLKAPIEIIAKLTTPEIAGAVWAVRQNKVRVEPGYDGLYGRLVLPSNISDKELWVESKPAGLDYWV